MSSIKSRCASRIKKSIARTGVPLAMQKLLVQFLPLGSWEKSLVYQQCLANRVIQRHGSVVQGGPFKGMKYIPDSEDGCLMPKLLGCYEEELTPAIEGFLKAGFDRAVDVGCASGYFLVGLAFRQSKAEVFGFDTDLAASARCARNIALNGLGSQVTLGGFCTPDHLNGLIQGRTLLVIDCEGAEYELLDPSKVPNLRGCDMIVELHDFINDKISATLRDRFTSTHSIEVIRAQDRSLDAVQYPALATLPKSVWFEAVTERRPCVMEWMVLRSNTRPKGNASA
jgi:hypothetical protein